LATAPKIGSDQIKTLKKKLILCSKTVQF